MLCNKYYDAPNCGECTLRGPYERYCELHDCAWDRDTKTCVEATCSDGLWNNKEEGVDCGGDCPTTCSTSYGKVHICQYSYEADDIYDSYDSGLRAKKHLSCDEMTFPSRTYKNECSENDYLAYDTFPSKYTAVLVCKYTPECATVTGVITDKNEEKYFLGGLKHEAATDKYTGLITMCKDGTDKCCPKYERKGEVIISKE